MCYKAIHKFDKFNPIVSGVFHPLGLEVIINSEIWDLRTFKLLHTVPALNQCQIRFTHDSSVLYGGECVIIPPQTRVSRRFLIFFQLVFFALTNVTAAQKYSTSISESVSCFVETKYYNNDEHWYTSRQYVWN